LTWSPISLGRWFGTRVRVHLTLIIFIAWELIRSAVKLASDWSLERFPAVTCWLGLLVLALVIHELGHALAAYWLDRDQEEVHLWPLGSLVGPSISPRTSEHYLVALAGPITSGAVFVAIALWLFLFAGARIVWNPFGNNEGDPGVQNLANGFVD